MDPVLANRLAAAVRAADPDRYFATLFAPAPQRAYLFALYAFNAELARVAENVREPMLGEIRLEWWRESVEAASKGVSRNHDVARGLTALFAARSLAVADFEALIAARAFDSSPDHLADFAALESYLASTSGAVMRLAARLLAGDPAPGTAQGLRDAGLAYGLTGLLRALPFHSRRHKLYLPLDLLSALDLTPDAFFHLAQKDSRLEAVVRQVSFRARDAFAAARRAPKPGAALAAVLPAALVPVYLRRLPTGKDVPIHRRQMALLGAAMRKRL
jgi:phytoene synthase